MDPSDPSDPEPPVRPMPGSRAGAACALLALVGLYLWQTRDEVGMSAPALALSCGVGLLGVGLFQLGRVLRWRGRRLPRMSDTGYVVAAAVSIAVVAGSAAWTSGEWLGSHSALGSVGAGFTFGFLLWCGRAVVQGLPPRAGDAGDEPR